MTTDLETCVELAQHRLRDIVTAANKADPEEMRALLNSSIANELPTKSKWCLDKSCLIIDKYEFTVEEFIQHDAKTTDRYCLFGPMPNRYLPNNEENEQLYEKTSPVCTVLDWQFGAYTGKDFEMLEKKARQYLIDKGLLTE